MIKKSEQTQEEILSLYINTLDLNDYNRDVKLEKKMFQELGKVEYFLEWIDLIVAQDLNNYFNASTEKVRDNIRGHAMLLIDLKKRCVLANAVNIPSKVKIGTVSY